MMKYLRLDRAVVRSLRLRMLVLIALQAYE